MHTFDEVKELKRIAAEVEAELPGADFEQIFSALMKKGLNYVDAQYVAVIVFFG